jgi:exopolysaccharide production protein ExoZ
MNWLHQRFELSRGGEGNNVRSMEGLRGIAVFLVFLVHYVTLIDPMLAKQAAIRSFAHALHTIGNTGVDLFFVLSGYLIYGSLISRPQSFLRFMSRRVQRIYPTFLTVFVIYIGLSFAFPAESKVPHNATDASIYLIQNLLLLPGLFPIEPMITVAWSLSYEMFYYLITPLVISILSLRTQSVTARVFLFSLITIAIIGYCAAYGGHIRLVMFVSGILLHETIANKLLPTPKSSVTTLFFLSGLFSPLLPLSGSEGNALKIALLFGTFFVVCFACFSQPVSLLGRIFSWTPLRWLGNMSYSYYLLHGLTLKAGFLVLGAFDSAGDHGMLFFTALLPLMFALTFFTASILFLTIERPFSLKPALRKPISLSLSRTA